MTSPLPVTVVIATRNRWDELRSTLGRLSDLPEQPRVVVVDNQSADDTPRSVRRCFPHVTLVALPANLGAAARNVGARLSTNPFVAFSDDDSWWEPGALVAAVELMRADPQIGLLAGHILVGTQQTADPTSEQMADGPLDEWLCPSPDGPRGVTGFLACAAVVRRHAFLAVGGFERHLIIGGEEELLSLDLADAGWKLVYAPQVVACHHPSRRRDITSRQQMLLRNHLLTASLRYSGRAVGRRSVQTLRLQASRPRTWPAASTALRSLPWALSRRHLVAPSLERAFTGSS
jgi:GT2 family glycosyltransferase